MPAVLSLLICDNTLLHTSASYCHLIVSGHSFILLVRPSIILYFTTIFFRTPSEWSSNVLSHIKRFSISHFPILSSSLMRFISTFTHLRIYLNMLSLLLIIWRLMTRWMMNNELEAMFQPTSQCNFTYYVRLDIIVKTTQNVGFAGPLLKFEPGTSSIHIWSCTALASWLFPLSLSLSMLWRFSRHSLF
jgi:hypothetical protein